jgi:hypothetical protein
MAYKDCLYMYMYYIVHKKLTSGLSPPPGPVHGTDCTSAVTSKSGLSRVVCCIEHFDTCTFLKGGNYLW